MKKIRILVIGGRFMPHVIGILADPPDKIELIISEDSEGQPEQALQALNKITNLEVNPKPLIINAYRIEQARQAYREVVSRYSDADVEITFDVTSAPKIPGFAARDIAREKNHRLIFVDSFNGKIINVVPEEEANIVDVSLKLEDYLRCYGRSPQETFDIKKLSVTEQQAFETACFLASGDNFIEESLALLRSWSQGQGKRTIPFKKTKAVNEDRYQVFQQIEHHGLIRNLQRNPSGEISYQMENDHDYKFLEGNWLEYFVYKSALSCRDEGRQPLFSNVRMSVEIPSNGERKEVDIACVYHGQLLHISCKTSNPFRTSHLDELRAVSDLVGGDFTTRFFVTHIAPQLEKAELKKRYEEFCAHAKARKVVVVSGERLTNIDEILKKEAMKPSYSRV